MPHGYRWALARPGLRAKGIGCAMLTRTVQDRSTDGGFPAFFGTTGRMLPLGCFGAPLRVPCGTAGVPEAVGFHVLPR